MAYLRDFLLETGVLSLTPGTLLMIAIGLGLVYLAVGRKMESYVLLPIGLGIIVANLPLAGLTRFSPEVQRSGILGILYHFGLYSWNLLPPLIFLGLGAMMDFGPLIARPSTLLLGAAAQVGIFLAFWAALAVGFAPEEAAAIGIIGGADGPTTIFVSARLAPHILGVTAVAAYSYIALIPIIQPPIMRLLTTKKERAIVMPPPRPVSTISRILFPLGGMIIIILLVPESAPLISMLMIGNLLRESGVVPRLSASAQNEVINVVTIFLMLTVGGTMTAEQVLHWNTLLILAMGLAAFAAGTAGGILFAKLMNLFSRQKINPLIGSAGVSAVPMAARVSHMLGQETNQDNFLLPHALGPNVAGVIGSAVAAGVFLTFLG